MILVKCKCGCHFTVKSFDSLPKKDMYNSIKITCQNCYNSLVFLPAQSLEEITKNLEDKGFTVYNLPDDVSIDFSFKA